MMEGGDGVLIATDRCTHGGHHSPYLLDDDDDPMCGWQVGLFTLTDQFRQ